MEPRTAHKRHDLKTWPKQFKAIVSGRKKFEIRKTDDRDFRAGDELFLREWNPEKKEYTGRYVCAGVLYITEAGEWGLPENLCVMSLSVQYWYIGDSLLGDE